MSDPTNDAFELEAARPRVPQVGDTIRFTNRITVEGVELGDVEVWAVHSEHVWFDNGTSEGDIINVKWCEVAAEASSDTAAEPQPVDEETIRRVLGACGPHDDYFVTVARFEDAVRNAVRKLS